MVALTALSGGRSAGAEAVPPHSIDAEQALLGAILINAEALDRARDLVRSEDFHEEAHGAIFAAMCARRDAGEAIDWRLIKTTLGDRPFGDLTVGSYVARLAAGATTVINSSSYARTVAEAARMRAVLATAQSAVAQMTAGAVIDPAEFAAAMIADLDVVATAGLTETARRTTLAQSASSVLARVDRVRRGLVPVGVSYGVPKLDRATLGLRPGQLVILAGRPGMGKTAVALHIALSAARAAGAVGFFSLEMDGEELAERILASLAYDPRLPALTYRAIAEAHGLSDEALMRLDTAERASREIPIWIEQEPALSIAQIAARARQMRLRAEKQGRPLTAIVVDHIGLVRPSKRYTGNRVQELTEITGGLKGLAKQLGIPVIALSQLNRNVEHRDDKRPKLSDLRESGSVEQDADVVLGLFREEYYLENKTDRTDEEETRLALCRNQLEIEILKQRSGPTIRIISFCDIACNIIAEAR